MKIIWDNNATCSTTDCVARETECFVHLLLDRTQPWETKIGHVIPHVPAFCSRGDASLLGGGALSDTLEHWFDVIWCPKIHQGSTLNNKHADHVHVNCLEHIVVLLQTAAATTAVEEGLPDSVLRKFPNGVPVLPLLLALTDDKTTLSWSTRVTAKSWRGQQLTKTQAALHRRCDLGFDGRHLSGKLDVEADPISRPECDAHTPSAWRAQMFQQMPKLKSCHFFLPSPDLVSVISSHLFSEQFLEQPKLPSSLGRFVPVDSITSSFVTI